MEDPGAKELVSKYQHLLGIRSPWESLWAESASLVMPRRAPGIQGSVATPGEDEGRLFDTTAVQANMTLAQGRCRGCPRC